MDILCIGPCWMRSATRYLPTFLSKCPNKNINVTLCFGVNLKIDSYYNNFDMTEYPRKKRKKNSGLIKKCYYSQNSKETEIVDYDGYIRSIEGEQISIKDILDEHQYDYILVWFDNPMTKNMVQNPSAKQIIDDLIENIHKIHNNSHIIFVDSRGTYNPYKIENYIDYDKFTIHNLRKYWKTLCESGLDNKYHNTVDGSHTTVGFGKYYLSMTFFYDVIKPLCFEHDDLDYYKIFYIDFDNWKIPGEWFEDNGISPRISEHSRELLEKRYNESADDIITSQEYIDNYSRKPTESEIHQMIELIQSVK